MIRKPELPNYMRDMEIKHALKKLTSRESAKVTDEVDEVKVRPTEER
ncbi:MULTISPECIES: hypothetical protein [Alicyclobacillus]|uniref:Uncharacterized protein n=1 Tax=Alicyclobacillus acidoterrestris (strain ATCC 49025 / DSM 3922 / CIP 106132 / NCIMB 13137 / GD3B) TaxID=1356854 RepID=T0BZT4_ALIAG|nr:MULTISPECIES: hypothetical protein [Alicyclobacillus]EPZ46309.1 hypothetical protein N007_07375 [Alicyclobacillus acidoterrestris ATCC 49025]UNO50679.1 hypothetical protein K1I37_09855 [Alicyclobacillus acidoterrestris]GEO24767.1 hypothetical protein AAC03nite_05520 [Alicyclobacillus acidoterrestris]